MRARLDIAGDRIVVLLTWWDTTSRQLKSVYDQLILVDWVNGDVLAVRPLSFPFQSVIQKRK
jgi:hypothetical protein